MCEKRNCPDCVQGGCGCPQGQTGCWRRRQTHPLSPQEERPQPENDAPCGKGLGCTFPLQSMKTTVYSFTSQLTTEHLLGAALDVGKKDRKKTDKKPSILEHSPWDGRENVLE